MYIYTYIYIYICIMYNVYVYVYDSIDVISIGNNINPFDVPSNGIHKVIYRQGHGGVLLLVRSVPAL